MEIQHFSHHHPLVFIQDHSAASKAAFCDGCEGPLEDWSYYGCQKCEFYLHKKCAELELEIQHPFHPKHPLTLLPKSPYLGGGTLNSCDFCNKELRGFVYNCKDCAFVLHINCALLQSSIAANFRNSLHPHPLFFIQNHNKEVEPDCLACQEPISGPFYHCSVCTYRTVFNIHKECAELPFEINHPYDRKHPLTLLPQPPTHPQKCSCSLCRTQWSGYVYSCSLCNFDLSFADFFSPPTITVASHEHPWMLVSRKMSFVCDFCGTDGDHSPYFCATCHLLVHKNCISLPRHIMITRHRHTISLSYSLRQNQVEDWMCKICYEEVDINYGHYRCPASRCRYIAHVRCATDKAIWDGTIMLEGYDEMSEEVVHGNLITDVAEQIRIGELMVASEIKHSYHDHNLRLTFSGKTKNDDSQCDGCTRPLSTPFYSCEQCKFFLHKDCAELPIKLPHPFHKHLLTLSNTHKEDRGYSRCRACGRPYQGFQYQCYEGDCEFDIDIQCMLLSETLKHPSHDEHSLFLVHNNQGTSCSACFKALFPWAVAYRCMKRCDFRLDVGCATLPLTAWYKNDRHPLTLTYSEDSEPSQHYCDLCEKERRPNRWFYYCADCDNSLHLNCAIGDLPYMKLGGIVESLRHQHPLTLVKNIWNCPPCKVCGELCNGQALGCKELECNFTVHWKCVWRLTF